MTKLYQYFKNDFNKYFSLQPEQKIKTITEQKIELECAFKFDSESSTRFFTIYIPESRLTTLICGQVLTKFDDLKKMAKGVEIIGSLPGDLSFGKLTSVYSNRIYFYTESLIKKANLDVLSEIAEENNLHITIRTPDYVNKRIELDQPLAFISHDSRDKELIAKPLAQGLSNRLCPVWYDEYSLTIGDSLRESIEKGIKESKKCVIIITKNFLSNPGWGKREFNSIFTREMIFDERIVLPIWHNVTKEEVYEYSPSLADTVALIWPNASNFSENEYKKEMEKLISEIHTAVSE